MDRMLAAEMVAKKVAQSVSTWASWSVGLLAAMTVAWMVGPLGAQLVAKLEFVTVGPLVE